MKSKKAKKPKKNLEENSSWTIAGALSIIIVYLLAGTIFFHLVEGWNLVDSFYVSGITLSTVGYGDLVPKTVAGKMVSVFFGLSGLGIIAYSAGLIGRRYFEKRQRILEKLPRYRRYDFEEEPKER